MEKEPSPLVLYSVHLVWDDAHQEYVATVPEHPPCCSRGRTRGEALKNVEVVMEVVLRAYIDRDVAARPIPLFEKDNRLIILPRSHEPV